MSTQGGKQQTRLGFFHELWSNTTRPVRALSQAISDVWEENIWLRRAGALVGIAFLLIVPRLVPNNFYMMLIVQSGLYVMMAWGLNIIRGYAGIFNLGYAAFFLIGAYMWGVLASPLHGLHMPFLLIFPLAGLAAGIVGWLLTIPGLGLRDNYLAITTLSFGEIIRLIVNNLNALTGGPNGIPSIDNPVIFGFRLAGTRDYYYVVLALCAVELVAMQRLVNSRIGRAWMAVREDEDAARAMGLDVDKLKMLAQFLGAFPAGLAGVLFAGLTNFISPVTFTAAESTAMFSMVIVGGSASIPGTALGAIVLSLVTEWLRNWAGLYRLLFYGVLLTVFAIFRPQGLIPSNYGKLGRKEQARLEAASRAETAG